MKSLSLLSKYCIIPVLAYFIFGCAANTYVTSEPEGATIIVNGTYRGETPVRFVVQDKLNTNDVYVFKAELDGYKPEYKIFKEEGLQDARSVIPEIIHFTLRPDINAGFQNAKPDKSPVISEDSQIISNVMWRAPGKTRVVAVGIGKFGDTTIPKVDYASSDAQYFASFAKSAGIPQANITYLADEQATRNDITDSILKMKMATSETSETAIFYFSGHGAPVVKDGKVTDAVLVPYDAKESSLEFTGIRMSTLQNMLSDVRGNWIVILDACFSGKEGRSLMVKNVKGVAIVPKGFNAVSDSKQNSWWVTATSGDNFANDFPKVKRGLFTYYLLRALSGEKGVDINEDGLISLQEAFTWTKTEVQGVSAKSLGRLQVPELTGQGDIFLTMPGQ